MSRRRKLRRGKSRKMFSRGANRLHRKNVSRVSPYVARGGVRL